LLNVSGDGDQKEVAGRWGRSPSPDPGHLVSALAVPCGPVSAARARRWPQVRLPSQPAREPGLPYVRGPAHGPAAGRQQGGTNLGRPAAHMGARPEVRRV